MAVLDTKVCKTCAQELPRSDFTPKRKGSSTYVTASCKECMNRHAREKRAKKAANEGRAIRRLHRVSNGMKVCNECNVKLPLSEYRQRPHEGRISYEYVCKSCYPAIQRRHYYKRIGKTPPSESASERVVADLQRKADITYDYSFARTVLMFSRPVAIDWIAQGYGEDLEELWRWGFLEQQGELDWQPDPIAA